MQDAIKLVAKSPVKIGDGYGEEDGQPVIDSDLICLNGIGDDVHESFYLPRDDVKFNFCKTARKPYDLIVTAMLIMADYHAPNAYRIASDGEIGNWQNGLDYATEVLGYNDLTIPIGE